MNNVIFNTAIQYHQEGLQLIPIQYKSKLPVGRWEELQYKPETLDYIENNFKKEVNIGIIGGQISGNFFALDFDNRKIFDRLYSKYNSFQKIVENTPLVETRRGYHLYLRSNEPLKKHKIKEFDIDLQGHGAYVVAPPSLYETGQPYLFQDKFKPIYTLNNLEELEFINLNYYKLDSYQNITVDKIITPNHFTRFGLSVKLWDCLINNNYKIHGYNSRSESEMAITLRLIALGWNSYEIEQLFLRLGNNELKGIAKTNYITNYCYPNALEYYKKNVSEHVKVLLLELYPLADSIKGRTKETDKAVYITILRIGQKANRINYLNLPIREIALESNISKDTAYKSLKRLSENKYILKRYSNRYDLNLEIISIFGHTILKKDCVNMSDCGNKDLLENTKKIKSDIESYKKDAFVRSCLGLQGFKIVNILNENYTEKKYKDVLTIESIRKKTGFSYNTISRKLKLLEKHELLKTTKDGRTYCYYLTKRITGKDLEILAIKTGVAGTTEKRSNKIDEERIRYNEYKNKNEKNRKYH